MYHGATIVTFMKDDLKMKNVPNISTQNAIKEESFKENNISDENELPELSKLTIFYKKRCISGSISYTGENK